MFVSPNGAIDRTRNAWEIAMQSRNLIRAFLALWWTLGLLLLWYSVRTVMDALSGPDTPGHLHIVILASLETLAALLFLIPRTMRVGGIGLLVIFVAAFALHAAHREFASQLILYAAAVTFIVVHGARSPRSVAGP